MNARSQILPLALRLSGRKTEGIYEYLTSIEHQSADKIKKLQTAKLSQVLLHAYQYVPYYRRLFKEHGLITHGGRVQLERFSTLPLLTKKDIREHFDELKSRDPGYLQRRTYENTSGGSTGEPVKFIQDQVYSDWNIANKLYFKSFGGQQLGYKELRLWGSERDILQGRGSITKRLSNWVINRREVNMFRVTSEQLKAAVELINTWRPTWIEAYVQSAFELARFIQKQNLVIHAPKGILTSAGTLYPGMKASIQEVFKCPVYNRYGSREVGDMACSCQEDQGLHLASLHHYFEITDKEGKPVDYGETGQVVITTLNNYSMPLIRYAIGDIAERPLRSNEQCSCGRGFPLIARILGRDVSVFRTKEGTMVDGEYFTHLFYFKPWCQRFQVRQYDYHRIGIKIVVDQAQVDKFKNDQKEITMAIKKVMGNECDVQFSAVDSIEPSSSGKFMYCISEIE